MSTPEKTLDLVEVEFMEVDVSTRQFPNRFTIIDVEDLDKLESYKWHSDKHGYVKRTQNKNGVRKKVFLHRLIMNAPKGLMVDHINHNPLDNRKCNLRLVNNKENQYNTQPNKGNKYKGVYKNTKVDKFEARIGIDGDSRYLGIYPDEPHAAIAYDIAAKIMFGSHAFLNDEDHPTLTELITTWKAANE